MNDTVKLKGGIKLEDCDIERVFLASSVLPSAVDAFVARVNTVDDAAQNGDIVLDTNALLIPYGAGANSFQQIMGIFKRLKDEGRIYLPAQVAREFVKNRPNKISELHQGLLDKISRFISIEKISYPILDGIAEYVKLNELLARTKGLKKEIGEANSALLSKIHSWEWSDPVNTSYKEIFADGRIVEPILDREEALKELLRRQRLLIPPGYKDSGKDDHGIGDFLIWQTILEIGKTNKKDLIFVSGDEKADWQHRAGGAGFLPRFELLDEYRRASEGKAFYIIQLSKLLELLSAESSSVAEIKQEEERVQEANTAVVNCPYCNSFVTSRLEEFPGSSAKPRCSSCDRGFHIHRTRNGITIHKPYEKTIQPPQVKKEFVDCPVCGCGVEAELPANHNATAWCSCSVCEINFPIHRLRNGGIRVSSGGGQGE
ncbi:PIN domain-containing protein [Metapseudomonas otitidis]|uniref:PIN domain-containing protein n=1 Tax=Metapseudomonas otitidis TaxID=319939 RepID=UPI0008E793FF|nr:PIN domain-containing protein [Pseudomonas otitidis]SFA63125.1 rRNA-processing protein FCF1 [Pseudomonas otitidis]